MSTHPFGLSEDPFATGYELTLEETRQLIQNRVSACGRNGGELFPPATCAEIHRRARGTASAALKLAQHAMLRAAREGAPAVSPAHVNPESAEPIGAKGPSTPAPAGTSAPALPAAPTKGPAAQPLAGASRPAAKVAAAAQPPPSVEIWATGPPAVAVAPRERVSWTTSVAVFLLFVAAVVVLILFLHPSGPANRLFARTSAPQAALVSELPPHLADDSVLAVLRAPAEISSIPAPVRVATATARTHAVSVGKATPSVRPSAAPARAESGRAESPGFGLEVARFLVRDRARTERRRLLATGHDVRVMTGWEGGAQVFRIVLGSFPSTGEAERIADQLLASGRISQARVVAVKQPTSRSK